MLSVSTVKWLVYSVREQNGAGDSAGARAESESGQATPVSAVRLRHAVSSGSTTQLVDVQLVSAHLRSRPRMQADDRGQDAAVPGVASTSKRSPYWRPGIFCPTGKLQQLRTCWLSTISVVDAVYWIVIVSTHSISAFFSLSCTLCFKKVYPLMFDNKFGKCGPICQNYFTSWFVGKFSMIHHKDFHHTCSMLLHYLVKIENLKMLLILTASSTNC